MEKRSIEVIAQLLPNSEFSAVERLLLQLLVAEGERFVAASEIKGLCIGIFQVTDCDTAETTIGCLGRKLSALSNLKLIQNEDSSAYRLSIDQSC